MQVQIVSLTIVCGAVASLAYLSLAFRLLGAGSFGRHASAPQRTLAAIAIVSTGWGAAVAIAEISPLLGPVRLVAMLDVVRYAALLLLLIVLLAEPTRSSEASNDTGGDARSWQGRLRGLAGRLGMIVGGVLVLAMAVRVFASVVPESPLASRRLLMLTALPLPVVGLVLVEQVFRNLVTTQRWSVKPLCLGIGALFAFDVYLYAEAVLLGRLDEDFAAIRPLAHTLAVPLIWVALRRTSNWQHRMQVSHRAVFYSAALLLIGVYLLFMAAVGYYVRYAGGDWGRALQQGLVFASGLVLLLLVMSASLRAKVRVFIAKHFFSYRYDYREEWLAFTDMLASTTSPQETGERAIRAMANTVECPAGSLWLSPVGTPGFRQTARWNSASCGEQLPENGSLVRYLRERAWVIDLGEYRKDRSKYAPLDLPDWLLQDAQCWAIVPLPAGEDLLGWISLAPPRTPVELDWETRDLLKTAGRQAAGYLSQMQATEALLEVRKFDAFNRMSAFVVHDLKNIITQLSLMMKNAQRLRDNPEFQEDMLLTVESSLEKMRRLMLQLREGATPPDGTRGVELAPIVGRLEKMARSTGRDLDVQVDAPLATRGHEERLERVLGHLVQNALDATPPEGKVWLKVERFSGQVRVEIGDEGKGMSEEFIRDRLFRPFSSTKQSGMGIGTYESAQYIREIGGSIDVRSALGQGTVMSIQLPLFDVQRGSDLQPAGTP